MPSIKRSFFSLLYEFGKAGGVDFQLLLSCVLQSIICSSFLFEGTRRFVRLLEEAFLNSPLGKHAKTFCNRLIRHGKGVVKDALIGLLPRTKDQYDTPNGGELHRSFLKKHVFQQ